MINNINNDIKDVLDITVVEANAPLDPYVPEIINLPEQKALALELLTQDMLVKQVVEVTNVNLITVYRWMTKEPFKSALNKIKELILDELTGLATERLLEMLASDNIYAQQFAISQWSKLMASSEINVKVEEKAPKSLEDLLSKFDKKFY